MSKKEPRLLRMFERLEAKDEIIVKGKWKRIPEDQIGEQICRDDISKYRRWITTEEDC